MKAALTVKMKGGYLIVERDIDALTTEEIFAGAVVDTNSYSYQDRVGKKVTDILGPFEKKAGDDE